ncbi:hypothetical protein Z517_10616 [Fonsecaea pedrosoi CBS 271.37]|uniref:Putative zinc-finger domain-containing protein n=1 Tax=Fonsecaea pedrosoi CBS 271.37 TaxID=1442368 RepID=A0A0D2DDY2_9EURO|nr:uncharacterized protein Z517_10616 [Fonsecaea pedrosoi CBS 271.37]KIW75871.1 hypothetical protein Z517_10616 [Fonsecaea pedrosoi CBS 271.37]
MAHPYSSTSLYPGTPSYAPQQPYYPVFPSNGLQQTINTPPGIPQQLPQPQGQIQSHSSYQPQPSPVTNGPRFDANSQIRPPAPPFHPFPPPTTTFNSDFFKQFASAGFPPPPPPNFPPVPIPGAAYPQLPGSVNTSTSSPYSQHVAAGVPGFNTSIGGNEQTRQSAGDQFIGGHTGSRGGLDAQSDIQLYGPAMTVQNAISHQAHPLPKGKDSDKEQTLPSFGSRSDIDMLFASAQNQAMIVPQPKDTNSTTEPELAADGNVSPYDPTRPAAITDRASGGFGSSNKPSKSASLRPVERTYDNKSLMELRQLAKGAVLSLVPHRILYTDLVKEGVNPQILHELYEELGLRTEASQSQAREELRSKQPLAVDGNESSTGLQQPKTGSQNATPLVTTAQAGGSNEPTAPPAAPELKIQQAGLSPSLERKDRIAQLLAAKTGRPTSNPASATPIQNEASKTTAPTTALVESTGTAIPSSNPQNFPVQLPQPVAANQGTSGTKPKAQTELVKQKMEQLRREAQAKTGGTASEVPTAGSAALVRDMASDASRSIPLAENVPPSSVTRVTHFESQAPVPSLIPGLFMSSTEPSTLDEATGSVTEVPMSSTGDVRQSNAVSENETSVGMPNLQSSPSIPTKRPSDSDPTTMGIPLPKKPNLQQNLQQNLLYTPSLPLPDSEADYQSEGEIVEEPGSDAMAMGSDSEQDIQEFAPADLHPNATTSIFHKPKPVNQSSTKASQTASTNESGKDELYRAKQTEIEAMRRKIAELEQRNKLKRTRSQVESPSSSNPPTPAVAREDQQLASSPVPQTIDLPGISRLPPQRQHSGPSVISKLTPAQLQEREAVLKQALLRQRAQRQQVLQEGLPDLNAKVKKTETRLEDSRRELVQVRAQIQKMRMELDRLVEQERRLVKEESQFEEQLQEGRSGQKRYSDELQQIRLEKLAEAQAAPAKEELVVSNPSPLAVGTISELQPDLSNGHLDAQDKNPQTQQGSLSMPVNSVVANESTDDQGDANMTGEDVHESLSPDPYNAPDTFQGEPEHVEQLQADEMEISPEPEDYVETHEHLPENMEETQMSDEDMDVDNDSDGSASMSGSDEEEYEPADVDTSQPMQHSEDESEEYDPETAPVDSVTPTTVPEDVAQDFHETSENAAVSRPDTTIGTPVDGAHDIFGVTESDTSYVEADTNATGVDAVSEVPANTKDDLESGDQLTGADTLVRPPPGSNQNHDATPLLGGGTCPPPTHYIPYKTPLSAFKTYRFHSDYPDTVKSGYRSLTYSNNIDPSRPLCPTELSGTPCTDPECEEQHFTQLGLPDEKILVQMSSASDIKDKPTRDEFHAGLKQVIAGLRANEVKDFEKVADALSVYRRKFFAEREERERQEDEDTQPQADQKDPEHQEQEVLGS